MKFLQINLDFCFPLLCIESGAAFRDVSFKGHETEIGIAIDTVHELQSGIHRSDRAVCHQGEDGNRSLMDNTFDGDFRSNTCAGLQLDDMVMTGDVAPLRLIHNVLHTVDRAKLNLKSGVVK